MTVKELIKLLETQPDDYNVAVSFTDHDNFATSWDAITGLDEVVSPDDFNDGSPGLVVLNYEGNEIGSSD